MLSLRVTGAAKIQEPAALRGWPKCRSAFVASPA